MLGDCKKKLLEIPDKSIDLVVTDPPYIYTPRGGGASGLSNRSAKVYDEIEYMSKNYDIEIIEILFSKLKKINAYFFCSRLQLKQYLDVVEKYGLKFDILKWNKTNPVPTFNGTYMPDTEYIVFMREKNVTFHTTYERAKTFFVQPANAKDKKVWKHPTIKPLNILNTLILNSSDEGDVVLDPFMGSGSTGVSALNNNRNFIGIEIKEQWFDVAKKRINQIYDTSQQLELF